MKRFLTALIVCLALFVFAPEAEAGHGRAGCSRAAACSNAGAGFQRGQPLRNVGRALRDWTPLRNIRSRRAARGRLVLGQRFGRAGCR